VALGNYSGGGLWVYDQAAHAAFDNDATHMDENIIWVEVGEPLRGWEHLVVGSKIFGNVYDVHNSWHTLDGNVPHQTMPFEGSRISLVVFTRSEWPRVNPIAKKCLQALGGQLPDIHGFEGSLRMKVAVCGADMNDGGEAE